MAARLKVFSWSDGFHAFTVAASSRPKALEAWGINQDIFASGLAHQVADGAAHDAALLAPGQVIQTGEAVDIGALEKARPAKRRTGATPAQKARLDAIEEALKTMDEAHSEALAKADRALAELKKQRDRPEADQVRERAGLAEQIRKARGRR